MNELHKIYDELNSPSKFYFPTLETEFYMNTDDSKTGIGVSFISSMALKITTQESI